MGIVMIKCPNTGRSISTGMEIERSDFNRLPVFFSRTSCPLCRNYHEWFAGNAWVCESNPPHANGRCRDAHY